MCIRDRLPDAHAAVTNFLIDSKLRGCDPVKLAAADLGKDDRVRERFSVTQSKTKRAVQFELMENTRETVLTWLSRPKCLHGGSYSPVGSMTGTFVTG